MATNVRVTVIAAGFDRWDSDRVRKPSRSIFGRPSEDEDEGILEDIFGEDFDGDLDVPDFLK